MLYKQKYLKYKKKYNELKLKGGTLEAPGLTYMYDMNIRPLYNDDSISNNISLDEYKKITSLNDILYFKHIYGIDFPDNIIKKILKKFNLYYKKLYLRGVGIENYPYGIYQLKNFITLSNDFLFLLTNNIIKAPELILHTLTHDDKNFIEVIRFEKDVNDNYVLQNITSEKISDPGYILKGIYYYPCIGSGIFLHYKNIKYYYNKLNAITEMHHALIALEKSTAQEVSLEQSTVNRTTSAFGYGDTSKYAKIVDPKNKFTNISKENIIKNFIEKYTFGRFDPSKNITLANLDFIINNVKRFNYLNNVGYLEYLFKTFCSKSCSSAIKNNIYELYYKIFSCTLTFSMLIKYINSFDSNSDVYTALERLQPENPDINISELLKNKNILNNFIIRNEYLSTLIKKIKNDPTSVISPEESNQLVNNIMIEIYTQIYTANFNQVFIDSTLFYYARKLEIDTVVLLCEPTDKSQNIGTEVISIEDFQGDTFNRTINCAKIKYDMVADFNPSLTIYLNTISEYENT